MKIYIAGPMTGLPEYNFPAFDKAAAELTAQGHEVFNPAQNDRDHGFDASGLGGHEAERLGFSLRRALKQDLSWICDHAEGLALLPNWQKSAGVAAEIALAHALGVPALPFTDWIFMGHNVAPMSEATA
jgi:hypothetical protein